jgi:polyhydroxyalkanoate synthesis regulator phasin
LGKAQVKNIIVVVYWVGLLACGWACSEAEQIEFRMVVSEDQDCVSCEMLEYVNSAGIIERLSFSERAGLILDPRDVRSAAIWRPRGNASGWSVKLDLDEGQQSEWLEFVSGTGGGRVIVLVNNQIAVVLEDSEMRFLVLSEFKNLDDVEKFLSATNLTEKAVQISDAQIERGEMIIREKHPKLDDLLQKSDELLQKAEDENERWKRLDSSLDEEPQNQEAALAEVAAIM